MTDETFKRLSEYLLRGCSVPQAFDFHMVVDREMKPENVLAFRDSCTEARSIKKSVETAADELDERDRVDWLDTDDEAEEDLRPSLIKPDTGGAGMGAQQ